MESDTDLLMISSLQHFAFCRRQWALIHLEQQWLENVRTIEGMLLHRNAHDEKSVERRGSTLIVRGLRIRSQKLSANGVCDVVEFHQQTNGVELPGYEGTWLPYPVEYKRGSPKEHDADALQLCAQAMCLEEMLACSIQEGSLYYGETRRRQKVAFTPDLRQRVTDLFAEMAGYGRRGHTPRAKPAKRCNACSLKDVCLPRLNRSGTVSDYVRQHTEEVETP